MARYRKIDVRIWNDEKFATLDDPAKLVFFMLLTHPNMTSLGAMRATPGGLAEEIGWNTEAFREAFQEVLSKGMAEHDARAHLIALPNFLRYNEPESPNVVKAWVSSLDLLPECELKTHTIQRARSSLENKGGARESFLKAFQEAFGKDIGKAIPNQEQERNQERDQEPISPPYQEGVDSYTREPGARRSANAYAKAKAG